MNLRYVFSANSVSLSLTRNSGLSVSALASFSSAVTGNRKLEEGSADSKISTFVDYKQCGAGSSTVSTGS